MCGPPRYAEIRINISQAFNGVGTVIAPVLGSYVFFNFSDERALANVQWVYLAIAVFVLILAFLFFIANIPEITDAGKHSRCNRTVSDAANPNTDMAFQAEETHAGTDDKPFVKQYRLFHAAFAQFCYTGAQVAIASSFITYATNTRANTSAGMGSKLFAGAQAAFTVGRFGGTLLMRYVRPRWVFLGFLSMCIIFIAPAITQGGNAGVSFLYVVLFFESVCFPTIVALGMRGLGRHTKRGSGYIVGGVVGGACVPPLLGVAADKHGNGIALVVPLAFFVAALTYPLCVNFVPSYTRIVDSFGEAEIGLTNRTNDEEKVQAESLEEKPAAATVA